MPKFVFFFSFQNYLHDFYHRKTKGKTGLWSRRFSKDLLDLIVHYKHHTLLRAVDHLLQEVDLLHQGVDQLLQGVDLLLQGVVHRQLLEYFCLAGFPDFSRQEHFVHHSIYLVEVEDKIKFANIVKIFVENFNKVVDGLQVVQVVIVDIHADAEVKTGIATIDNLEVSKFDKVGVLSIPHRHNCMDFFDKFLLLLVVKVHVPLGQPGLARPVLDHDEPDHRASQPTT